MPILTNTETVKSKKHWLLAGAFLLLLIVGAKIDFDFGEKVSFTLQTLFLGLGYFYLPFKQKLTLVLVFLTLGIAGAPVFNGGVGWEYFSSYPLGFFFGFVVGALVSSPSETSFTSTFTFFMVLHLIILALGTLWLAYYATLASAVQTMNGLLIGVIIKSLLGAVVVALINKYAN